MPPDIAAAPPPPLWRFITASQYHLPPEPARETVRRGFWGLWESLRGSQPQATTSPPECSSEKLSPLSHDIASRFAAAPSWQAMVPALQEAWQSWGADASASTNTLLILCPPWSGTAQGVAYWAQAMDWPLLDAPPTDSLLDPKENWGGVLSRSPAQPWVIPHLERWYLRHHTGLRLLRDFLSLLHHRPHPTIVACHTWAWAYLSKTLQVDSFFPPPLILEAFDRSHLEAWLPTLDPPFYRDFIFRQADNGKFILPPPPEAPAAGADSLNSRSVSKPVGDFLARLAASSRGIPGIAWAMWRSSLSLVSCAVPSTPPSTAGAPLPPTLWFKPWSQLQFPRPAGITPLQALLLHALLLHDGLSAPLASRVLPFGEADLRENLLILAKTGLVATGREAEQEIWRVTALGYPAIREYFQQEGFLVDSF